MITRMKLSEIKTLPENPPSRISLKAIKGLIDHIQWQLSNNDSPLDPRERLIVGNDGLLGDGHRRLAALLYCGVEEFEVEIDPKKSARQIWFERSNAKPLTSDQVSQAGQLGLPLQFFPKAQRTNADRIRAIAGEKGLKLVFDSGVSLGIHQSLSRIANYLGVIGNTEYCYKILDWLIRHKMQRLSRMAIESGKLTTTRLRNCIDSNKPLKIN